MHTLIFSAVSLVLVHVTSLRKSLAAGLTFEHFHAIVLNHVAVHVATLVELFVAASVVTFVHLWAALFLWLARKDARVQVLGKRIEDVVVHCSVLDLVEGQAVIFLLNWILHGQVCSSYLGPIVGFARQRFHIGQLRWDLRRGEQPFGRRHVLPEPRIGVSRSQTTRHQPPTNVFQTLLAFIVVLGLQHRVLICLSQEYSVKKTVVYRLQLVSPKPLH